MNTASAGTLPRRGADRFLIGIVAGVLILLVAAGVSVAVLRQPAQQLPEGTPAGTVQRFLAALDQKDYDKAYSYLSESMSNKPSRDKFALYNMQNASRGGTTSMRMSNENAYGDHATVDIAVTTFYTGSPFGGASDYTDTRTFTLQREAGQWRITDAPYSYLPYVR